jgi:hypothetical protein
MNIKNEQRLIMRIVAILLCAALSVVNLAACNKGEETPSVPVADEANSTVVDQYYANENFMIEMLVNKDCDIEENGYNLMITTADGHAAVIVSLIPGIQNLLAAGEMAIETVMNGIPGAKLSAVSDGNLFGARAKLSNYEVADENGTITLMGIEAAAIVNQSCYFLNVMMEPGMYEAEGDLIINVFSSMNVLRPAEVDQTAKEAVYTSHYQQQLDAKAVAPSAKSQSKPVSTWSALPYYYYSWLGDPGDYGYYPSWYYEPDWDYYSDPGDYWDWGWDDSRDWWFYDEYSEYYDYEYYQGYDDYWYDYDPYSDPGDYYSDGYGDYIEDGYGDYFGDDY